MKLEKLAAMISRMNDYTVLKWPTLANCILMIILVLIMLLCFQSDAWFTYDIIRFSDLVATPSETVQYSTMLEYGSLGLWHVCIHHSKTPVRGCDTFTYDTRPQYFHVILMIYTCALYFANFMLFPSWAAFILLLYSMNNRYIRYVVGLLWLLLVLSITITVLLLTSLVLVAFTKMYSPGRYFVDKQFITFHTSKGVALLIAAISFSLLCLLLTAISLVWKRYIDLKIIETEQELRKQLADDTLQPAWQQPTMIPRTPGIPGVGVDDPPPYSFDEDQTTR